MEIRNIQATGGSSFSLTLPKNWIKQYCLKNKSKLVINIQKSGALVVLPYLFKKSIARASLIVDYMSKDEISREIIAYYLGGADEITLKTKKFTPEQIFVIRNTISNLIGLDILNQTSDKIIIKNIFDNAKFPISENVSKMFMMIIMMHQDVFQAIENRDKRLALDVVMRDTEVDKLYLAVVRQFHSVLQNIITEEETGLGLIDLHYYESVATQLERIADHTVKIANMVVLQSKKSQNAFAQPLKRITKKVTFYLQQAEKTFRLLDKKSAHNILDYQRFLNKNIYINKNIVKKSAIDIIIEDSVERIQGYIKNIAEETIDYIAVK